MHSRVEDACCHSALRRLFPKAAKAGRKVERYPTRIVFCAYMIKVRSSSVQITYSFDPRCCAVGPAFHIRVASRLPSLCHNEASFFCSVLDAQRQSLPELACHPLLPAWFQHVQRRPLSRGTGASRYGVQHARRPRG